MHKLELNGFNFRADRFAVGDVYCHATESPLIHDGSQMTADADLSGPAAYNPGGTGAALAGQLSSGQFLAVKITGARTVGLTSSSVDQAYGILQNKPATGQAADVGIMGVSKAVAGAIVTAGNFLMSDTSGRLVPSTGTNARIAQAIEGAAATSTIFTVEIFPGAHG